MAAEKRKMDKDTIPYIFNKIADESGAKSIEFELSGKCLVLNENYFKLTTLREYWVIEWTDNIQYARMNCFEDVDLMPYNINEKELKQYISDFIEGLK